MSLTYFLTPGGNEYKANLHNHTTLSDGHWTPEQVKERYMAHGYSIVAYTDHDKLVPHTDLTDDKFVALTAVEASNRPAHKEDYKPNASPTYHFNCFCPDKNRTVLPPYELKQYSIENAQKTIDNFVKEGFLVQYNHPRWSFQLPNDFLPLKNLWGFEVYNTSCDPDMLNAWGDYEFETYCRYGDGLPMPTMDDDNHDAYPEGTPKNDSFGGYTIIKADKLTYDAVFEAMKTGNCYSSQGPQIKALWAESGKLCIETDGVAVLMFLTDTRTKMRLLSHENDIFKAEYALPDDIEWVRIQVRDKEGRYAFTRAIKAEDIKKTI